jgi:hypothetical protein
MSHGFQSLVEVMIALATLAMIVWPMIMADCIDGDGTDSDQMDVP